MIAFWWPGVRLLYFGWMSTLGGSLLPRTDFSQLTRVLPPEDARLVAIYSGLPHQRDGGKLLHELFAADHRSMGGYRFYSSPIPVPSGLNSRLSAAMQSSALYLPSLGPKLCGGYHPDHCFEWQSAQGTFYALFCRGCHQVILVGGGTKVLCDLNVAPAKALDTLLDELKKASP